MSGCCSSNTNGDCCSPSPSQNTGKAVPVGSKLGFADYFGMFRMRLGIGRDSYSVAPGLYSLGNPGESSPVLVSANYKMSFDILRRDCAGLDAWILVLDTKGINVWCAAGKGTFGTDELVRRIRSVNLPDIIAHKKIILPQLGAPGVAAHEVQKQTGFRVSYGPVRSKDIKSFIAAGYKADAEMRLVRFTLRDRLVLTPVELHSTLKYILMAFSVLCIAVWIAIGRSTITEVLAISTGLFFPFAGALICGAVITPVLLPCIPGRSFAWKGAVSGAVWALCYLFLLHKGSGVLFAVSMLTLLPAISSFLSLNFTGASTYTSLSGVMKEMKIAVPLIITACIIGVVCYVLSLLASGGLFG